MWHLAIIVSISLICISGTARAAALKWDLQGTDYALGFDQPGVEHKFTCTNVSSKSINVLLIRTSCGCTAARMAKTKIGPGETANLIVDIDARKITGDTTKLVIVRTDETDLGIYQLKLDLSRPSPWKPILPAVRWEKSEDLGSKEIPLLLSEKGLNLTPVGAVSLFPESCGIALITKDSKLNSPSPYSLVISPRKRGLNGLQPVELLLKTGNKIMSFKLPFQVNVD